MSKLTIDEQLQVGDYVIYLPENIITKVVGYHWNESIGQPPALSGYRLGCDIVASFDRLEKIQP